MPQIKTFCRIKPTEEYYPEFELSTAVLHLRVPELLRDIGSPNKNQRNIVSHEFNFDYIFNSDTTQEQVFDVAAKEIVEGFLNGYNGTIFAYGQTGTGKTFTVEGSPKQYKHRGLEPRALSMIYKALEQRPDEDISVHLSYLEIYKEVGYDLLNPGARTTSLVTPFPKVSVLEGQQGIWVVRNLSVHYAASEEVAQNLLIQGQANRRVAATTVHDRSSRSHAVFTIQLSSKKPGSDIIVKSKLHLVDLAGSERVSKTGAEGHLLNEAKCINLSLHYLETVIVSLQASVSQSSRQRQHSAGHYRGYSSSLKQRPSSADGHRNIRYVPYRNSLLTMVLRDSLGGNCLTAMIATISLEPENLGESISTCRFAGRVACIANRETEEVDEKSLIRKLRRRVAELESELHCLRFGKENIDAMNAKMTDEDKLYCSITSPYKFRESLRVLKKMVLEGYFNKNNNDDVNVLELESKNYPRSPERQTFKSERRSNHRSPERKKQRNNQNGLTTSGDDNTSEINVQVNKRQQQEKTVEFPINAWEPAEPEVKPAPKPKKIKPKVLDENKLQDEPISKPVTLEDRDGNDVYKFDLITKLNVTKDQVEDQHAYIQQLKTTEADSKLIEQEKLVEKQLLKRQYV
ncbi:hypothetical protein KUTeg_022749 [Tegillarca granosa]|uniref:Kinesin-like protein n=1 Tax=Tegillarca granosa TaxID=220873 RepID=A0ABQ9E057_TEGGR|nr:hypothetical protein KUTeg_022749 [Tegillarca granosa]